VVLGSSPREPTMNNEELLLKVIALLEKYTGNDKNDFIADAIDLIRWQIGDDKKS
jgi:hypothetical protein